MAKKNTLTEAKNKTETDAQTDAEKQAADEKAAADKKSASAKKSVTAKKPKTKDGFVVCEGCSLSTKVGILSANSEISADQLNGGEDTLKILIAKKLVKKSSIKVD